MLTKQMPIGGRYGKLVILGLSEKRTDSFVQWLCQCDCGRVVSIRGSYLRRQRATSCGCSAVEATIKRITKHGLSDSATYSSWQAMKARCTNESSPHYSAYGGAGIGICDRWMEFEKFIEDMGERPVGHSLDRIDGTKGYSPENCRWADSFQQNQNRNTAIVVCIGGREKTLKEWARESGLNYKTLYAQYRDHGISKVKTSISRLILNGSPDSPQPAKQTQSN